MSKTIITQVFLQHCGKKYTIVKPQLNETSQRIKQFYIMRLRKWKLNKWKNLPPWNDVTLIWHKLPFISISCSSESCSPLIGSVPFSAIYFSISLLSNTQLEDGDTHGWSGTSLLTTNWQGLYNIYFFNFTSTRLQVVFNEDCKEKFCNLQWLTTLFACFKITKRPFSTYLSVVTCKKRI